MSMALENPQHLNISWWRRRKRNHGKRMKPERKWVASQGNAISQKLRKKRVSRKEYSAMWNAAERSNKMITEGVP